ncbi:MAG: DUF4430 domain-containing protein [Candidatus Methanodesulfokora sp.]|jgi:hypothetical protein
MERKDLVISVLLIVILVFAGILAKYNQDLSYCKEQLSEIAEYKRYVARINLLLDYGNGTRRWYNGTIVPLGSSLLNATMQVASVNYTLGAYGAFVNSINGVSNDKSKSMYWMYWVFRNGKWVLGEVSADNFKLKEGDIVAWFYENCSKWPPEPPR